MKATASVITCGFVGGTQADSLQNSLKTIQKSIDDAVKQLVTSVKKEIEQSSFIYNKVSGTIANAFGGLREAVSNVASNAMGSVLSNLPTASVLTDALLSSYDSEVKEEIKDVQQRINEMEESGYAYTRQGMSEYNTKKEALQEMIQTGEIVQSDDYFGSFLNIE